MITIICCLIFLIVIELICFTLPFYFNYLLIDVVLFLINGLLSWYIIKSIEKKYYQRYQSYFSILYMSCPLIGVILLSGLLYYFSIPGISYLTSYFCKLYLLIFIINIGYVIFKRHF